MKYLTSCFPICFCSRNGHFDPSKSLSNDCTRRHCRVVVGSFSIQSRKIQCYTYNFQPKSKRIRRLLNSAKIKCFYILLFYNQWARKCTSLLSLQMLEEYDGQRKTIFINVPGQWCRSQVCKRFKSTPKHLDLLKIWAKSRKIDTEVLKFFNNINEIILFLMKCTNKRLLRLKKRIKYRGQ